MTVYIIAQLKFTHRERYDRYQARFADVFRKFRGRVLVADERPQLLEGPFERDKGWCWNFPTATRPWNFRSHWITRRSRSTARPAPMRSS